MQVHVAKSGISKADRARLAVKYDVIQRENGFDPSWEVPYHEFLKVEEEYDKEEYDGEENEESDE
ncbi:hypothetical protein AMAG_13414 [Allomyces macrogynus ATCC 38327]|uniref:Uncharacterized protein n=1 Tax=Allomyces macrogynus (strain ATCC 38327) TaxID=578462 RepID=A0A0L0T2G3_ALLM3|nr:hypothetical protein AMAG_13414 [Allomyces macrogynus ATCC 38327]|eukprot:KNE68774.1 hypothetical protein AMAG_13414 [Allomyces macrogynus ATCC 38327]